MTNAKEMTREVMRKALFASSSLRRLGWRVGRSLYCLARGEPRIDDMRFDGELELQSRVVDANRTAACLVAFDVGANQGDWTLALLDTVRRQQGGLSRLRAHVFEPVPATHQRLVERLKTVVDQTVRINACAASDKSGTFDMAVMTESGGTNSLVFDDSMAEQAIEVVPVTLTTLDIYCAAEDIAHIHIVKCDTEGHDLAVIRGSMNMLRQGRIDIFQFEYNHRWITARTYLKDVFDLIDGLPYKIARVMPHSVEIIAKWSPELERYFHSNYVLLREAAIPSLRVTGPSFDASDIYS